jgi:putative phosphoesterase
MVRIGIISDIHGYIDELKRAVHVLENFEVDAIICAGDLVDKGPDSNAVVSFMSKKNIPCVQGNHDAKATFGWTDDRMLLSHESIHYLRNLPQELHFEWGDKTVYMSHCNPWHDASVYVYRSRPIILFEQIAAAVDADVIVMGHTHQPLSVCVNDTLIVNPGAVYGNISTESIYDRRDTDERTCGVLTLPDGNFELYHIETGMVLWALECE